MKIVVMIYCFSSCLLARSTPDNEFAIQARYAQFLGKYCLFDVINGAVFNEFGKSVAIKGKRVLLRASCEEREYIMRALDSMGAILLETLSDIEKIENWPVFYHERPIVLFREASDIKLALQQKDYVWMTRAARLFIKSVQKGFSAVVKGEDLLSEAFWNWEKSVASNISVVGYILSEAMTIAKDQLGRCEVRFFIRDYKIQNASRMIHTLQHQVDNAFGEKAGKVARTLQLADFPANYVLDLAAIETPSGKEIVVIEINTVTSSMCYVNNSIFPRCSNTVTSYGIEYEYDRNFNAERYHVSAESSFCYEYNNEFPVDMSKDKRD